MDGEVAMEILLILGVMVGFYMSNYILIIAVCWLLASTDTFFTFMKEATYKAVVTGDGAYWKGILSWMGKNLDENGSVTNIRDETWVLIRALKCLNPFYLLKILGVRWVGVYPLLRVYSYNFKWVELDQDSSGNTILRPREEATDFVFVNDFTYAIPILNAEINGNLSVNTWVVETIRVVNPRLALFNGEDWMQRLTSISSSVTRSFIGGYNYEDIVHGGTGTEEKDVAKLLNKELLGLNTKIPGTVPDENGEEIGLMNRYGICIVASDILSVELSEASAKLREATTKRYVAEQEAATVLIAADAEAKRVEKTYDAVIHRGKEGMQIRMAEALEKSGEKGNSIVWANDPFAAVAGILGRKSGS